MASKPAIPQNDNVAHALAGAGGGILSMILTYVLSDPLPVPSLVPLSTHPYTRAGIPPRPIQSYALSYCLVLLPCLVTALDNSKKLRLGNKENDREKKRKKLHPNCAC